MLEQRSRRRAGRPVPGGEDRPQHHHAGDAYNQRHFPGDRHGHRLTVFRLANELRKTTRRCNALQHIFIPEYEAIVTFIISSLEEREREDTFRLKLLKNRNEKADRAEAAEEAEATK